MTIEIYNNTSDSAYVSKNITRIGNALDCHVYEPCTVERPIFKLKYSAAIAAANYLHCSTFGRYYYITDHDLQPGGIMLLHCQSDPLMSFADSIRNINCTITRQENAGITMYPDNNLPILQGSTVYQYGFPSWPFTTYSNAHPFLLELVGGVVHEP